MPPDSAALIQQANLLRQQVVLSQVRIMELEDVRDELMPRLEEAARLLAAAQALADAKLEEAAHLERVRADLQQQFEHMRHTQHVTNQALEQTRAELQAAEQGNARLLDEVEKLQVLIGRQAEMDRTLRSGLARLEEQLAACESESATRLSRLQTLDAEQRAMKASRSWRWTRWLRSLERTLGGRKP